MRAVAERLFLAVLASAPGDGLGFGDLHGHGGDPLAQGPVGAVAVGLVLGVAAGAPFFQARLRFSRRCGIVLLNLCASRGPGAEYSAHERKGERENTAREHPP